MPRSNSSVIDLERVVSFELKKAGEFLKTLEDPRAEWSSRFDTWAQAEGLSDAEAKAVRVCVLRLRVFHTIQRTRRRR
jgi:hypothetical protein